jgi:hypothetical protein
MTNNITFPSDYEKGWQEEDKGVRPKDGVSGYIREILGRHLSKVQQMSNWASPSLSLNQLDYAGMFLLLVGDDCSDGCDGRE